MAVPYAEVIGDPIAHSKSPLIHKFWLTKTGISADYRPLRIQPRELPAYFRERRRDNCWRGCSVTAPLKQGASELVGAPLGLCDFVGAVNCVVRTPLSCLFGTNTDLNGVEEALAGTNLPSARVCLMGTGGAAGAALCYLVQQRTGSIVIFARNRKKAEALMNMVPAGASMISISSIEESGAAVSGADIVINATPMGMAGAGEIDTAILDSLSPHHTVFDMVYAPVETRLLRSARAAGAKAVDGLTMLIGQAAPAFQLFFGAPAPRQVDAELRRLLVS